MFGGAYLQVSRKGTEPDLSGDLESVGMRRATQGRRMVEPGLQVRDFLGGGAVLQVGGASILDFQEAHVPKIQGRALKMLRVSLKTM